MRLLFTLLFIFLAAVAFSQKVGINITNPEMALHVRSADSAVLLLSNVQAFADSAKTALYFHTGYNFTGAIKTHVYNAAVTRQG